MSFFSGAVVGVDKVPMLALGKVVLPIILRPRLDQALNNLKRILEAKPDDNMRAARLFRFGPAKEALVFTSTAARPTPKKGEVLVRVGASSINQIDLHRRAGYGRNALRVRGALNFPIILGNDYAGTVVDVGEGVSGISLGTRVFGAKLPSSQGSFADYIAVSASDARSLPDNISFETAAAIPYVFLTAWSALVTDGGLKATSEASKRVFVQGGAGGVGSMAIVIAKQMGAYVAASCLAGQSDIVRGFGADEVFEGGSRSYAQALRGYDIALCAANPNEEDHMLAILGAGGRYVSVIHPTLALTDELGLLKGFMKAKKTLKALNKSLKPANKSAAWTLLKITPEALDAMAAGPQTASFALK